MQKLYFVAAPIRIHLPSEHNMPTRIREVGYYPYGIFKDHDKAWAYANEKKSLIFSLQTDLFEEN